MVSKFDYTPPRSLSMMQRMMSRDVWESDKRLEPNWWLKESVCDYCLYKSAKTCDYCAYKRKSPFLSYQ